MGREELAERLTTYDRTEWLSTAAAAEVELAAGGRWTVQLPRRPRRGHHRWRWTTTLTLARERRVLGRALRMAEPDWYTEIGPVGSRRRLRGGRAGGTPSRPRRSYSKGFQPTHPTIPRSLANISSVQGTWP